MSSSITILLLGLSACDSLLIVTSLFMFGLPGILNYQASTLFNTITTFAAISITSLVTVKASWHSQPSSTNTNITTNTKNIVSEIFFCKALSSEESPPYSLYVNSVYPYIVPFLYPVSTTDCQLLVNMFIDLNWNMFPFYYPYIVPLPLFKWTP